MAKRAKRTGSKAKGDKRARRAAVKARRAGADAGQNTDALVAQLPRVDALEDVPAFADLAADTRQRAAYEEFLDSCEAPDEMCLGCVVRLDRGFPLVVTEDELFRAEHAVAFAKLDKEKDELLLPAIGDWVAVRRAPGHEMGVIERVLPRCTAFERPRGRLARGEKQTLAANVDTVLIVQALGEGDVPVDRIARALVLSFDCGARPVVVLTKADRKPSDASLAADVRRVQRLAGEGVRVLTTSSARGSGLEEVRGCLPAGSVGMILGASGAGKSTLLNNLLGHEALETGAVRERDDAGRHTTVARVMIKLPGAGVIADAPGLRSLPLLGHERGLARLFPEIVQAARACRFNDCTHTHEPGCAVRAGLAAGELDDLRYETFSTLAHELRVSARELDPDVKA